jgi:hypothetical protein
VNALCVATALGPATLQQLRAEPAGRARRIGRHALLLRTPRGAVLWCDTRPGALGPLGLTLDRPPEGPDTDTAWAFNPEGRTINLDHGGRIGLDRARTAAWDEVRVLPGPCTGLHDTLPGWPNESTRDPVRAAFLAARTRWIASLATGLRADDACALLGLGPGLTPSGDDLVGGFVLLRAACGALPPDFVSALTAEAARSTHTISRARLAHHLRGEGSVAECDLVRALRDGPRRAPAVEALRGFGHHSGDDFHDGARIALWSLRA